MKAHINLTDSSIAIQRDCTYRGFDYIVYKMDSNHYYAMYQTTNLKDKFLGDGNWHDLNEHLTLDIMKKIYKSHPLLQKINECVNMDKEKLNCYLLGVVV